jgi:hypothetical protein
MRINNSGHNFVDRSGQKVGLLKVINLAEKVNGNYFWNCVCDCGNTTIVRAKNLGVKRTSSCGCLLKRGINGRIHGDYKSIYHRTWVTVKQRCFYKKAAYYPSYGGRGITMYDPWVKDYVSFREYIKEHLGERPKGYSLDRIDNNGNYAPGNIRWADRFEQCSNQRTNLFITANNETKTMAQWAKLFNVTPCAIKAWLRKGKSEQWVISHFESRYLPIAE